MFFFPLFNLNTVMPEPILWINALGIAAMFVVGTISIMMMIEYRVPKGDTVTDEQKRGSRKAQRLLLLAIALFISGWVVVFIIGVAIYWLGRLLVDNYRTAK